jgi:hypothetical protein
LASGVDPSDSTLGEDDELMSSHIGMAFTPRPTKSSPGGWYSRHISVEQAGKVGELTVDLDILLGLISEH